MEIKFIFWITLYLSFWRIIVKGDPRNWETCLNRKLLFPFPSPSLPYLFTLPPLLPPPFLLPPLHTPFVSWFHHKIKIWRNPSFFSLLLYFFYSVCLMQRIRQTLVCHWFANSALFHWLPCHFYRCLPEQKLFAMLHRTEIWHVICGEFKYAHVLF